MGELPEQLSPSRASDFEQCARLFYFKTILNRPTFSTLASATGRLTHLVLDELFEYDSTERTLERATSLVEPSWRAMSRQVRSTSAGVSDVERKIRDRLGLWSEDGVANQSSSRLAFDRAVFP